MVENIDKVGKCLNQLADKIVLTIGMLILWGLTCDSARFTQVLRVGTEIPVDTVDNVGINLVVFLVIIITSFLLHNILSQKKYYESDSARRILVAGTAIYVAVISVVWVKICHVVPRADGVKICEAADSFLSGDYDIMMPPGYMSFNPHQFNIVAVIQFQFYLFGMYSYHTFQNMNALCIPLLFYSGYQLLMLIYGKLEPVLCYIVLFVSCLPMFLYVPYVYGEITSITFTMVLMWQVVRYCKTNKKSSWFWGTLAVGFAYMMRTNSLVVLIAAGIVLVVYAARAIKPQAIAWLLAMFIAVFAVSGCVRAYYEKVSGNEIFGGIPYISYILMGLQDTESGPGWYNVTNYAELIIHDYDIKQTAIDNKEDVRERLRELWEDKSYGVNFFHRKISTQWNSPDYHSIFETRAFDCEKEELPGLVRRIYYDDEDAVRTFMNRYQFILYLCTAIMVTVSLVRKKQERRLEDRILLIAVVGGFLFSIIWEAMSRYVLPYVIYMIPLAAVGMWQLQELLKMLTERLRKMGGKLIGNVRRES